MQESEISRLFGAAPVTVDDLAREQGVAPVMSGAAMGADVWDSDAEVDRFLAEVRNARDADLA
jgi:phage terminase Nu1 subunit (DNA packaging protein)